MPHSRLNSLPHSPPLPWEVHAPAVRTASQQVGIARSPRRGVLLFATLLVAHLFAANLFVAGPALAQGQTTRGHAIVPAFERFYSTEGTDSVRAGLLLLGELNCVGCHATGSQSPLLASPKRAPILDQVGRRVRPEFLREFLLDPQAVKPGTTMPHVLGAGSEQQRREQAEALTHYLALTGAVQESAAVGAAVKRGESLFHQVGCVACHDRQQANAPPLPDSVPLGLLSKKYSLPSLQQFLAEPLTVRPSGRMPHLNLTADESRDIASYLLRDQALTPNVRYAYYEGNWDKLPDFTSLKPKSNGVTSGFAVNIGRPDNFAIRFEGFLQIAKEGQYRIHIGSDDGSRIWVDGQEVAAVDGIHPLQWGVGRVFLKAGAHPVVVEFFEQGGGEELKVEIEGPGLPRQALEAFITLDAQPPASAKAAAFVPDPAKAEQGRELFQKLACAACHEFGKDAKLPESHTALPKLARLNVERGCLATTPESGAPRYSLSAAQLAAIRAALNAIRGGDAAAAKTSNNAIDDTLAAFNCYACHQRGGRGGVVEARNASFQSNQPEMGDEGRIPPHLTGVGGKLRPEWLVHVFNNGAKDRPYMFTRMPKFGMPNVGHLVETLAKADPEPAYKPVTPSVAAGPFKATGRRLVGSQGFSCIKCHTWGNVPATGIQSIGMTTMTKRLREAWFHAYILDPPAFRAGTRMPAAWPMGQTLLPNVLGGETPQQIHSVWAFLSDGDKAAMPQGLGRDPIELMAIDEPVIYRNFIEGAGPRAIGVGYPQKVNLAFDANDLRLALAWQGSFIDASKHWTDRGVGFQSPLGDNVLKFASGVDFAMFEDEKATWPNQSARQLGYQFRGYRLNAQREPIFQYDVGPVRVEDHPRALVGEQGRLIRTLTLTRRGGESRVWFRAAVGEKIEAVGPAYVVDGVVRIQLTSPGASPLIKSDGNRKLLLVPVTVSAAPVAITQEITW